MSWTGKPTLSARHPISKESQFADLDEVLKMHITSFFCMQEFHR